MALNCDGLRMMICIIIINKLKKRGENQISWNLPVGVLVGDGWGVFRRAAKGISSSEDAFSSTLEVLTRLTRGSSSSLSWKELIFFPWKYYIQKSESAKTHFQFLTMLIFYKSCLFINHWIRCGSTTFEVGFFGNERGLFVRFVLLIVIILDLTFAVPWGQT